METQFYLLLSLKTPRGFENYGQFFLGNDRQAAQGLFESLTGRDPADSSCLLHIDLMKRSVICRYGLKPSAARWMN